jgi:DnaD/phage-associated family protein
MAADENGAIPEDFSVSRALGVDKADVTAAVKFWRGAGIIEGVSSASKTKTETKKTVKTEEEPTYTSQIESAHRGGVVESADGVGAYQSAELAEIFEKRQISMGFIDEAQRVFGKTFNTYDVGIIVGLVDQVGLDEEAVLMILAYVARLGKKGVRYAEKLAIAFYDEGYTTTEDIAGRIDTIERSKEVISQIKHLFGASARELSKSERTMFEKWTQKFGYGMDVIRMAYDITIDIKHEAIPKYTGAILESWYNAGLRTAEAIAAHENAKKQSKMADGKSYDLDDFFAAAMDRSLKDLKY